MFFAVVMAEAFDSFKFGVVNQGLTEVPSDHIPRDTRIITLSRNRITRIRSHAFLHMNDLKELYLDSNDISTIESRAFYGLSKLSVLSLSKNQIASLEADMFMGLAKDENTGYGKFIIDLSDNQITGLQKGVFSNLKSSFLYKLFLGNNTITEVTDYAFSGLNHLAFLHLNNNQIRVLEKLGELVSLKSINLWSNKLVTLSADVFEDIPRPLTLLLGKGQGSN